MCQDPEFGRMPVGPQEHSVVQTEILPAVCFGLYTVHCLMR